MVNYKDQEETALELLGISPEDCDDMKYARIREGYISIYFVVPMDKIYSYVDKFRKLKCNQFYEDCIVIESHGYVEYYFFFTLPQELETPCFDMWHLPLTEREGCQYV